MHDAVGFGGLLAGITEDRIIELQRLGILLVRRWIIDTGCEIDDLELV
jgi:hypothetical protein